jgi:hypothetical protein
MRILRQTNLHVMKIGVLESTGIQKAKQGFQLGLHKINNVKKRIRLQKLLTLPNLHP